MSTEDPTHLLAEGTALLRHYHAAEALVAFEQALAIQPEQAQAWSGKSVALLQLDRLPEALEAALHALQLDPTSAEAESALLPALPVRAPLVHTGSFLSPRARVRMAPAYHARGVINSADEP